jgi:SanA protein
MTTYAILRTANLIASGIFLAILGFGVDVQSKYLTAIHAPPVAQRQLPKAETIIILGASVKADKTPSDALRDRLLTGIDLYNKGYGSRILVTGDRGDYHGSNEVEVMEKFLLDRGIPSRSIDVDGQGYRTYESCKRARAEKGIQDAIVVTQRFHMARALYLCNALGVSSIGVVADRTSYVRGTYFWGRDLLSSVKAWWDIHVSPPDPPVIAAA